MYIHVQIFVSKERGGVWFFFRRSLSYVMGYVCLGIRADIHSYIHTGSKFKTHAFKSTLKSIYIHTCAHRKQKNRLNRIKPSQTKTSDSIVVRGLVSWWKGIELVDWLAGCWIKSFYKKDLNGDYDYDEVWTKKKKKKIYRVQAH